MKPFCLTIAGSDPTSGAGIQADIRTFDRIGVHPFSAITAITYQSATEFYGFKSLSEDLDKQLDAILRNYPVKHVKIGMIPDSKSLDIITDFIKKYDLFIVYDPVTIASAGKRLCNEGLEIEIEKKLFPLVNILTPNLVEAIRYSGEEDFLLFTEEDFENFARILQEKINPSGENAVIIKSVEILRGTITDVIFHKYKTLDGFIKRFKVYKKKKLHIEGNIHGTGCVFSSALTAYLSKGYDINEAMELTEKYFDEKFQKFIEFPDKGKVLDLTISDERIQVINQIKEIYSYISNIKQFSKLIPEVRLNISGSLANAKNKSEIAGIEGRITIIGGYPYASGEIKFGVSDHTARLILTAKEFDNSINFVMNLRYKNKYITEIQDKTDLITYEFVRSTQPDLVSKKEHSTMQWLIKKSVENTGMVPDIVWDKGSVGKEPIIRVFSKNSREMIEKLEKIIQLV